MKIGVTIILCFIAVVAQAEDGKQSDLETYIEGIRASGISEMGRNHLRMIAGICVGSTILEYRFDEASGRYWPSYMSAKCPKPGAVALEIESWRKFKVSESDKLLPRLKPFADANGSGFVTTEEASEFRWLIEYGYLAERVIRDSGRELAYLAKASGKEPKEAGERLAAYKELARRIIDAGVAEPPDPAAADTKQALE